MYQYLKIASSKAHRARLDRIGVQYTYPLGNPFKQADTVIIRMEDDEKAQRAAKRFNKVIYRIDHERDFFA